MGNSLIPNTNINKEAVGNCGANTQWVMHQGVRTDKTKDQVTVFLFDKRTISKQSSSSKEEFINGLKRDPHILAKFKNDGIVTLVNPLLEDQKRIGFVTETIKTPLNVLIDKNTTDEIVQSDLEIKLHILDIAETLAYLQSDAKAAHLAVSPENIYITSEGRWKLGGFLFSTQILPGDSTPCPVDFTEKPGHIRLTPNLKFTAPEVTESPSRCTFTSDMFSLACLIFTLYKIKADGSARDPYLIKANSLHGYREIIQHLPRFDYSPVPEQIRPVLMRMLHSDPNMRITAAEFVNNNWFKDPFVQTVKCLETIHQRDLNQQSAFLKGLSTIILKFEARFLKAKMIPVLNNLVRNAQLAASVLPVYFTIMDQQNPPLINREEFNTLIWPSIKLLVTAKEISAAALFLLIQKLGLFVGYLDIKEIEKVFIPILLKSLGCGVQKLQDLAIQQTVMIFDKIDYAVLKAQIMPKILELCLDGNVDLRKSAVLMLSKSFHVYDSVMINDQILPTLDKLRKLNNNYSINMAMLTVFQGIAKDIGTETIANKILVSLIPMLVVQTISKSEYRAFLSTIYSYLKRIEDEQNRRYEGMPDKPPEEAQAEFEKSSSLQPQSQPSASEGQFGGDFAFLNSTVPKGPEVSSSKGEFDFSAFNTYNQQASGPSQISTQPINSRASYDVKPSTNTFGLNNNAIQNRASVITQKVPATVSTQKAPVAQTQSTTADKSLGFNNLGPSAGAKSVTVQQSDPFKDFSQSNQGAFGQTSFNTIQGNKPQNPFAKSNPFAPSNPAQTNPFGAAPAPSKQNTSSFDAFQSFEQFGSQPKKEVQQQPFSSQWGQPTNAQNAQPSAAGWDNLDQELESFSTNLARPTFASKPSEKVSQDNFGFGFDSNVNQAPPATNQQQKQPQPQASQSWSQSQPQSQPQPSYQQQQQQYQQEQEQYYQQQQQQQYQQQNEYQQSQNQYGGSYQNEYPQEEPHYDYQQDQNQYGMNNENQFAQSQNEPPVQENPEQREADIIATVGANHPLRYLGSNMNMGLSAIRGKR